MTRKAFYNLSNQERNRLRLKVYREKRAKLTIKHLLEYFPVNPTKEKLNLLVNDFEVYDS